MLDYLKEQWTQLQGLDSNLQGVCNEVFQELIQHYSESERAYHNLDHIAQLLQTAETFKARLLDYNAVRLAIWFHDVIYNPLANDNEAESALFAEKRLARLLLDDVKIEKIKNLILATVHHTQLPPEGDSDSAFFLDFDLMILGSDLETYKTYTKQIRKEYQAIPDLLYKPGRKRILQRFYDSKRLFKTEEFYLLYEPQAKANIKWELQQLDN